MSTSVNASTKIIIIGGGVNGLSSAYYLHKKGFEVTVVDKEDISNNCSFGNMGFLSPSHFVPLAAPGIIAEGLKHLVSSTSPFYIKPRFNASFIQWAWKFFTSSNQKTVDRNSPSLSAILNLSRHLMNEIRDDIGDHFFMEETGCMMMCHGKNAFEEEIKIVEPGRKLGLQIEVLEREELQKYEPDVELDIYGALLFKNDGHIHPGKYMLTLKAFLEKAGVHFQLHTKVIDFKKTNGKIDAVVTNKGDFSADHFVLAPGAWLPEIAKKLNMKILLEGGKGYSFDYDFVEKNIKYPAILVDDRCAITPWKNALRIGGTMEFSGLNNHIMAKRMQGIYQSVKKYYPGLDIPAPVEEKIWSGLRPVSPDGLPYIGHTQHWKNVLFAGGNAMLGISEGAGTGLLVSQIISCEKESIDITAFKPDRFS